MCIKHLKYLAITVSPYVHLISVKSILSWEAKHTPKVILNYYSPRLH